jgi:hypothetical protein
MANSRWRFFGDDPFNPFYFGEIGDDLFNQLFGISRGHNP